MEGRNAPDVQHAHPNLAPHKSLSRQRALIGSDPLAVQPVQPLFVTVSPPTLYLKPDARAETPTSPLIVVDGEGTLPLTPPNTSVDAIKSGTNGISERQGSPKVVFSSRHSGMSTPTTARSPPTPDITPPSEKHLQKPTPSPAFSTSTLRAESFQTAREEQTESGSESDKDNEYQLFGVQQTSTKAYSDATRALRFGEKGLGYQFEHATYDSTPTQERQQYLNGSQAQPEPAIQEALPQTAPQPTTEPVNHANGSIENTYTRENGSLRRKKLPRTPPRTKTYNLSDGPDFDGVESSPSNSIKPIPAKSIPSAVISRDTRMFSEPTQIISRSARGLDTKRLSDASNSSTFVEAIIRVASPVGKKRTLRHVNKYTGLRNFSGSSIDIAQLSTVSINKSGKGSLSSAGLTARRSFHRTSSLEELIKLDSPDVKTGQPAVPVLRRPLRHSREYSHLRPSTASSTNSATSQLGSPSRRIRKMADSENRPQNPTSTEIRSDNPTEKNVAGEDTLQDLQALLKAAPADEEEPHSAAARPIEPVLDVTNANHDGEGAPQASIQPKSVLKSRTDKPDLGQSPITPWPPSPTRNYKTLVSTIDSQTHLMPVVPSQMQQPAKIRRPGLGLGTVDMPEDPRRVSFGDDVLLPHHTLDHQRRKSTESRRSIAHTLDETSSTLGYSSLYPPVTPLSISSTRSDAQIIDAKAVNLYPHTNESLLFIQHGSPYYASAQRPDVEQVAYPQLNGSPVPPAELHRAIDAIENPTTPTPPPVRATTTAETEDILHLTPPGSAGQAIVAPQLMVEPSTPVMKDSTSEADSPLRNPRSAPQPPAFKVIPPTPFSEVDDPLSQQATKTTDVTSQVQGQSQTPGRRISLMQRARRYSDSYIQPLFTRTVSVRRVIRPATGNANGVDHNLHPLWRPRGFWDDFSDSDSEDDYWGDGEPVTGIDTIVRRRLPRGGDTSDVRSLEQQQRPLVLGRMGSVRKVIMDGFRGSGGFLIGNSLGVDRAGTNRRRHHIALPSRLQGRYAPNRGVATLPSHVTERHNPAGAGHHNIAGAIDDSAIQKSTAGSGFAHNPTQPLSVRSALSNRTPSRTASLSSFPSSYTSTVRSKPSGSGWRRGLHFPFRVEYVGMKGLADRRREKKAERRRDDLRRQIGRGVLQENGYGSLRNI